MVEGPHWALRSQMQYQGCRAGRCSGGLWVSGSVASVMPIRASFPANGQGLDPKRARRDVAGESLTPKRPGLDRKQQAPVLVGAVPLSGSRLRTGRDAQANLDS